MLTRCATRFVDFTKKKDRVEKNISLKSLDMNIEASAPPQGFLGKNKLRSFLMQLFCRHDYEPVDKDEIFPFPGPGERILYKRKHVCKKCSKSVILGSGWIIG